MIPQGLINYIYTILFENIIQEYNILGEMLKQMSKYLRMLILNKMDFLYFYKLIH
jgi:hypothetical protein